MDAINKKPAPEVSQKPNDQLLAVLAHEIRNPLAAVVNGVQILRQSGVTGAIAEQTLDLIERQLQHVIRLMESLLPSDSHRTAGAMEQSLTQKTSIPTKTRCLRLLVVEDDHDVAKSMTNMLRLWGHDVRVVYDGTAVRVAAEEFLPHLVLLDLGLPGLDGMHVAEKLRQSPRLRDTRLVAVTALDQKILGNGKHETVFDRYFVKPVAPHLLKELLNSL